MSKKLRYKNLLKKSKELFSSSGNKEASNLFQEGLGFTESPQLETSSFNHSEDNSSTIDSSSSSSERASSYYHNSNQERRSFYQQLKSTVGSRSNPEQDSSSHDSLAFTFNNEDSSTAEHPLEIPPSRYYHLKRLQKLKSLGNYSLLYQGQILAFQEEALFLLPPQSNLWLLNNPEAKFYYLLALNQSYSSRLPLLSKERTKGTSLLIPNVINIILKQWPLELPLQPLADNPFFIDPRLLISTRANRNYLELHYEEFIANLSLHSLAKPELPNQVSNNSTQVLNFYLHSPSQMRMSGFSLFRFWDESFLPLVAHKLELHNLLGFSCRYGVVDNKGVSYPIASGLGSGSYYGLALPNFTSLPFIINSKYLHSYLLVAESILNSYFSIESYLKVKPLASYHYNSDNLYHSELSHFPRKSRDILSDLQSSINIQQLRLLEEKQNNSLESKVNFEAELEQLADTTIITNSDSELGAELTSSNSNSSDYDLTAPHSSVTSNNLHHRDNFLLHPSVSNEEIIDLSDEDDFYYPQVNREGQTIQPQALPRTQPQQLQHSPYEGNYSGAARTIDKIAESILTSTNKKHQDNYNSSQEPELLDYLLGKDSRESLENTSHSYPSYSTPNYQPSTEDANNQDLSSPSTISKSKTLEESSLQSQHPYQSQSHIQNPSYVGYSQEDATIKENYNSEDLYDLIDEDDLDRDEGTHYNQEYANLEPSKSNHHSYSQQREEDLDPSLPSYLRETLVIKKHAPEISAAHGAQGIALNPSKENLKKEIAEELSQQHKDSSYDDFLDSGSNFNPYSRKQNSKSSFLPQSSLYGGYEGIRLASLVNDHEEEEEADYSYLDEVDDQTLDKLNYQQPFSATQLAEQAEGLFTEQAYPQVTQESKQGLNKSNHHRYLQEDEIAELLASGQISQEQAADLEAERESYLANLHQNSVQDLDYDEDFTEFEDAQDYNYSEDLYYEDLETLEDLDEPLSDDVEEDRNLDLYLEDILLDGHYDHDGDFEAEDKLMRARLATYHQDQDINTTAEFDQEELIDLSEDSPTVEGDLISSDNQFTNPEIDYSSALQESLHNLSEDNLSPPQEEGFVFGGKTEKENLFSQSSPGAFALTKLLAKNQEQKKVKASSNLLETSQIFTNNLSQLNNYIPHLQKILDKLAPQTQILERSIVAHGHRYELKLQPQIQVQDFINYFNQNVNSSRKLHAYQEDGRLFIKRELPIEVKAIDLLAKSSKLPPYYYPLALDDHNQLLTLELKNLLINGEKTEEKSNFITTLFFNLIYNHNPEEIEVLAYLEDSNHPLHQLENIPHLINPLYYGNQSQEFIAFLYAELLRRRHLCASLNSRDYLAYNHFLQLNQQDNQEVIKPLYVFIDSLGSWFNASLDPNSNSLGLKALHYLFNIANDQGIFFIVSADDLTLDKAFPKGDFINLCSFTNKEDQVGTINSNQFFLSTIKTITSNSRRKHSTEVTTSDKVYNAAIISKGEITKLRDFWFQALSKGEITDNYRSYNLEYILSEDFYCYCIVDELIYNTGVKNKKLAQAFTYDLEGEFFTTLISQLEQENFITRRQEQLYVSISYPNFLNSTLAQEVEELIKEEVY